MSCVRAVILAAVAAFATGCSSVPKAPRDFDWRAAAIDPPAAPTELVLDGTRSSVVGGAATGAGAGVVAVGLMCGMFGPFAPLCIASYLAPTVVVGAVAAGTTVAIQQDSQAELATKRAVLVPALDAFDVSRPLAASIGTPQASQPVWLLKLTTLEVGTQGRGTGQPFQLTATAKLEIRRGGDATPAFVRPYQARSAERRTSEQWAQDDSAALRTVLVALSTSLAAQMACDLAQSDAQRAAVPTHPAGVATAGETCKAS